MRLYELDGKPVYRITWAIQLEATPIRQTGYWNDEIDIETPPYKTGDTWQQKN